MSARHPRTLLLIRAVLWISGLVIWATTISTYGNFPNDFLQDYAAGIALSQDESLYFDSTSSIALERSGIKETVNYHPPFTAILFWPTSYVSYWDAWLIWSTIYLLLLIYSVSKALMIMQVPLRKQRILLPLSLIWYPSLYIMGTGNISALVIAATIAAIVCLQKKRDLQGGALLALACLIKLFPAYLSLHLILFRKWKALTALILTFALGTGIACLFAGTENLETYYTQVAPKNVEVYGSFIINSSLLNVVRTTIQGTTAVEAAPLFSGLNKGQADLLALGTFLCIACFLIALSIRRIVSSSEEQAYRHQYSLSLSIVTMLLLSPLTWMHIFPLLVIPFALTMTDTRNRRTALLSMIALILTCIPDIELSNWLSATYAPGKIPIGIYLLSRNGSLALILLWISIWLMPQNTKPAKNTEAK